MKAPVSYMQQRQFGYGGRQKQQVKKREELGDGVPTFEELKVKYMSNLEQLSGEHEQLIEKILEEEENLIFEHN